MSNPNKTYTVGPVSMVVEHSVTEACAFDAVVRFGAYVETAERYTGKFSASDKAIKDWNIPGTPGAEGGRYVAHFHVEESASRQAVIDSIGASRDTLVLRLLNGAPYRSPEATSHAEHYSAALAASIVERGRLAAERLVDDNHAIARDLRTELEATWGNRLAEARAEIATAHLAGQNYVHARAKQFETHLYQRLRAKWFGWIENLGKPS